MEINNLYPSFNFISVEDALHPGEDLKTASDILNRLKVKWYLAFGTALGFYRDKDFIPGDTDIDIAVIIDNKTPVDKILEEFSQDYTLIRTLTDGDNVYQLCFKGVDNFIIDICFFYRQEDIYETLCEGGKYHDRVKNIGYTTSLDTKYGRFPIPDNIEEYLKDRYGDWKTPRHGEITSSLKV